MESKTIESQKQSETGSNSPFLLGDQYLCEEVIAIILEYRFFMLRKLEVMKRLTKNFNQLTFKLIEKWHDSSLTADFKDLFNIKVKDSYIHQHLIFENFPHLASNVLFRDFKFMFEVSESYELNFYKQFGALSDEKVLSIKSMLQPELRKARPSTYFQSHSLSKQDQQSFSKKFLEHQKSLFRAGHIQIGKEINTINELELRQQMIDQTFVTMIRMEKEFPYSELESKRNNFSNQVWYDSIQLTEQFKYYMNQNHPNLSISMPFAHDLQVRIHTLTPEEIFYCLTMCTAATSVTLATHLNSDTVLMYLKFLDYLSLQQINVSNQSQQMNLQPLERFRKAKIWLDNGDKESCKIVNDICQYFKNVRELEIIENNSLFFESFSPKNEEHFSKIQKIHIEISSLKSFFQFTQCPLTLCELKIRNNLCYSPKLSQNELQIESKLQVQRLFYEQASMLSQERDMSEQAIRLLQNVVVSSKGIIAILNVGVRMPMGIESANPNLHVLESLKNLVSLKIQIDASCNQMLLANFNEQNFPNLKAFQLKALHSIEDKDTQNIFKNNIQTHQKLKVFASSFQVLSYDIDIYEEMTPCCICCGPAVEIMEIGTLYLIDDFQHLMDKLGTEIEKSPNSFSSLNTLILNLDIYIPWESQSKVTITNQTFKKLDSVVGKSMDLIIQVKADVDFSENFNVLLLSNLNIALLEPTTFTLNI